MVGWGHEQDSPLDTWARHGISRRNAVTEKMSKISVGACAVLSEGPNPHSSPKLVMIAMVFAYLKASSPGLKRAHHPMLMRTIPPCCLVCGFFGSAHFFWGKAKNEVAC